MNDVHYDVLLIYSYTNEGMSMGNKKDQQGMVIYLVDLTILNDKDL